MAGISAIRTLSSICLVTKELEGEASASLEIYIFPTPGTHPLTDQILLTPDAASISETEKLRAEPNTAPSLLVATNRSLAKSYDIVYSPDVPRFVTAGLESKKVLILTPSREFKVTLD